MGLCGSNSLTDNWSVDPRRGTPHGGELRQAAGAAATGRLSAERGKRMSKICLSVGLLVISVLTALARNCDDTSIYPKDMDPRLVVTAVWACKQNEKALKDRAHTVINACIRKFYDDRTVGKKTEEMTLCFQAGKGIDCLPFDKPGSAATAIAATKCILDGIAGPDPSR